MFLPIDHKEMTERGWDRPDFVYVIGDAYVDHSSFGPAIISRILESHGYKVCILSQPDWTDPDSVREFGEPRLGFLVCSGNMDSMVNHYTVSKKRRSSDAYTPGGVIGKRPDYAVTVYCNLIKRSYKNSPVIIGGIEASLRRLAHYDYWSNRLKRSILMDSGADLLIYGMGEHAIVEIADALDSGIPVGQITFVRGTVYKTRETDGVFEGICLPDFEQMTSNKAQYAKSFAIQYANTDAVLAKPLIEKYGEKRYIVQNPPALPLTTQEFDDVYELPYERTYHPSYEALGGVPAISEIKFSLTSNRGCFGACSFCALTFHQGRVIQTRSHESLLREAAQMTSDPDFKGYIHDVGGPTADFRAPACSKQLEKGACPNRQCLFPTPCKNLNASHKDYVELLRKLRALPKVKKVFVRSGIRFDYMLADSDPTFLKELCKYHISGQLRVAPEHVSDPVLKAMGKPASKVYREFLTKFDNMNEKLGLEQYAVPYLMSSHPGSTLKEAVELAEYIRDLKLNPEQVQDFYPTPSTISTVMYYTGLDPRTYSAAAEKRAAGANDKLTAQGGDSSTLGMERIYVPVNPHEKAMQRALIQYRRPENYDLVREALEKAGRTDLIGTGDQCLIFPRKLAGRKPAPQKSAGQKLAGQKSAEQKPAPKKQGSGKESRKAGQSGNSEKSWKTASPEKGRKSTHRKAFGTPKSNFHK